MVSEAKVIYVECVYYVAVVRLHVNPLKKKVVTVFNLSGSEPTHVEKKEPMGWEDSAKVSAVLMAAQIFMVFLPIHAWGNIEYGVAQFLFDLFCFSGKSFFANFIVLSGLSRFASQ